MIRKGYLGWMGTVLCALSLTAAGCGSGGGGIPATTWYEDADGDGYTTGNLQISVSQPEGYIAESAIVDIAAVDCDDVDASVNPSATETCNDIDDDCDGTIDEDLSRNAGDVGACAANTETCSAGVWAANNEYVPADETCNYIDDDCDGEIDEDFTLGASCPVGIGECVTTGKTVCSGDGLSTICVGTPLSPSPEICDGKDNDCDGTIDEGFVLGGSCSTGVGECTAAGVFVCSANGLSTQCDAVPGQASWETCGDGLDSDCNGVDEVSGDCSAPGTATIYGFVTDGATPLADALARAYDPATFVGKGSYADASGFYAIYSVAPGVVDVSAAMTGYAFTPVTALSLTAGDAVRIDLSTYSGWTPRTVSGTITGAAGDVNMALLDGATGLYLPDTAVVVTPVGGVGTYSYTGLAPDFYLAAAGYESPQIALEDNYTVILPEAAGLPAGTTALRQGALADVTDADVTGLALTVSTEIVITSITPGTDTATVVWNHHKVSGPKNYVLYWYDAKGDFIGQSAPPIPVETPAPDVFTYTIPELATGDYLLRIVAYKSNDTVAAASEAVNGFFTVP